MPLTMLIVAAESAGHADQILPIQQIIPEVPKTVVGGCTLCPNTHFCPDNATMTPCPAGSAVWRYGGATNAAQCLCKTQYTRVAGVCEPCKTGWFCSGEIPQPLGIKEKKWQCEHNCSTHPALASRCALSANATCLNTSTLAVKNASKYDVFKIQLPIYLDLEQENVFLARFRNGFAEPAVHMVYTTENAPTQRLHVLQSAPSTVQAEVRIPVNSETGQQRVQTVQDVENALNMLVQGPEGATLVPQGGIALASQS
eukprot:1901082-Rhodomonas_salina.1